MLPGSLAEEKVPLGCAVGDLASAAQGNLLEAINLALDVLECGHEEVDLASTGKSVVVLTAGSGVFEACAALSTRRPHVARRRPSVVPVVAVNRGEMWRPRR